MQEIYQDYIHLLAKDSQVGALQAHGSRAEVGLGALCGCPSHPQGQVVVLQGPAEPPGPRFLGPSPMMRVGSLLAGLWLFLKA